MWYGTEFLQVDSNSIKVGDLVFQKRQEKGKITYFDCDNFWKISLLNKFDDGEFGDIGYVTNLFRYFENITDFKLTYTEDSLCLFCTKKQ